MQMEEEERVELWQVQVEEEEEVETEEESQRVVLLAGVQVELEQTVAGKIPREQKGGWS